MPEFRINHDVGKQPYHPMREFVCACGATCTRRAPARMCWNCVRLANNRHHRESYARTKAKQAAGRPDMGPDTPQRAANRKNRYHKDEAERRMSAVALLALRNAPPVVTPSALMHASAEAAADMFNQILWGRLRLAPICATKPASEKESPG